MRHSWGMFCLGVAFAFAMSMTIQDGFGLEGYIDLLRQNWIQLPWWVGALAMIIVFGAAIGEINRMKKKEG